MTTADTILPIQHVSVSGSALERGKNMGKHTRGKILHSLDTYERLFALCDIPWSQAVQTGQTYLDAVAALSPSYIDELTGMAQGAGVDVESLFTLNCRTEILPSTFLSKAMASGNTDNSGNSSTNTGCTDHTRLTAKPDQNIMMNECTSLAIAGTDANYWLAQNWDWCGLQRAAMTVVETRDNEARHHITVTEAGMLAKIGINQYGFAVTLNILRSNKDGSPSGIPVHFLLRALLDCESVAHAAEQVSSMTFSSSSNVMVMDAEGHIASFELSPYGVKILKPQQNHLCHTNHFLHDALAAHDVGRPGNTSTLNRLQTAEHYAHENMTRADIIELLSDQSDGFESICRFADPSLPEIAQIETVTAVIMNTAEKTLSVSGAQPSLSEFVTYSL